MKTVILSDIHGCYDQMMSLLAKTGFDEKEDTFIALGDFIDRGKQSFEVIEEMKRLQDVMDDRCILLRGNHEQMLIEAVVNKGFGDSYAQWRTNGANKTISSLRKHGHKPEDVLSWCQSLKIHYETEQFICVHAGMSVQGISGSDLHDFVWDRTVAEDGWYHGKLLIYGHTPQEDVLYQDGHGRKVILEPETPFKFPATGSICLDTGCVWGRKLSTLVINGNAGIIYNV